MNRYQLVYLCPPNLSGDQWEKERSAVGAIVKEHGGVAFFNEDWGIRKTSYRLDTHDELYYGALYFDAKGESLLEITNTLRIHPGLLRHRIIRLPDEFDVQSVIKQEVNIEKPEPKGVRKPSKALSVSASSKPKSETTFKKVSVEKDVASEKKLDSVEKTLDSILENPDIELK